MRSLVRPSIFPLVVSEELAKSDLGEGVKGNNIISSHQPRDRLLIDFIRLRLSYNFQFKGVSFVGVLVHSVDSIVFVARFCHNGVIPPRGTQISSGWEQ